MAFQLPIYTSPDFSSDLLSHLPVATFKTAPCDGVAPDNFHATSNLPEYVQLSPGDWQLVPESRMDCVIVRKLDGKIEAVEPRRLKKGDQVAVGRTENGEDGIYVHVNGFKTKQEEREDKFTFRSRGTRETPFSRSYDELYELLRHEKDHGYIVWVLGPAVVFDRDSRDAMRGMIENGYCQALMAGNALATHDLEAGLFGTGLGQDIYTRELKPLGHYHHLDLINRVRKEGSIKKAIENLSMDQGVITACEKHHVPYVLTGSIRDDGPLPEVISHMGDAQDTMRIHARKATTVITLATQLHSIAFGNMTPSYRVMMDGTVRPVYFYIVDMTEFSADKLANRGSAQAVAILTNVQDFMINLWKNLS